jgi:DeoR/GlpR family transcriptional regulator of sugar metabolism
MIPAVRREKIKNMILTTKNVSVINLSQAFSVSEETIRRDLRYLEEEGILTRTHGGAMIVNRVASTVDNTVLENIFIENKKKIALQCKQFIKNNDCIYLDSSTTSFYICKEILDLKLTLVTNSLSIINLLSNYENISVISTGGSLSIARKCFGGRSAIRFLNTYYVDKAFISCRSLSMSEGITDSNDDDAAIKETIVNRANHAYVVADYSKFNKVSFAHICDFKSISGIITDKPVSDDWIQFALDHQLTIWDSTQNPTITYKEQY